MTGANALRGIAPLVALAAVLGGCGGGAGEDAGAPAEGMGPGAGTGTAANIVIQNFTYSPSPAEVRVGQSVTVTNYDSALHTLTVPGGVDSGELAQARSFTFAPTESGTLDYLCDIHQYMKGQIIVR